MIDILGKRTRAAMPAWMEEQSTHGHHGCGRDDCMFGIRFQPRVTVALGLYMIEAILHGRFDAILYCDCKWGELAQARANLTWTRIRNEIEYVPSSAITSIEMQLYGEPDVEDSPTIRYVEVA